MSRFEQTCCNMFVSTDFQTEIQNKAINQIFPRLAEKTLLTEYLVKILNTIAIKFGVTPDKYALYEQQFRQNNYRDVIGLLYILLPYINDTDDTKKQRLQSLDEMYKAQVNPVDINKSSPQYIYTNLQYGRCKRGKEITEISFSEEHLEHNYLLLVETIKTVSHKFYTNWINIRPVDPASIPKLPAFLETAAKSKSRALSPPIFGKVDTSSLDTGEIYNILTNYLYYEIRDIKWTIYETKQGDQQYKLLYILNKEFNLDACIAGISWNALDSPLRTKLADQWKTIIKQYQTDTISVQLSYTLISLIYFFDKKLGDVVEYVPLPPKSKDTNDDDEEDLFDPPTLKKSIASLYNLVEHVYNTIQIALQQFKLTWYGSYFLENMDDPLATVPTKKYTFKNIYNYSKSLCHSFVGNKYGPFARLYKSLDVDTRTEINNRLNLRGSRKWFNIRGYLKNRAGLSHSDAIAQNTIIETDIQASLAEISFDTLSRLGVLTEFVPDPTLTNRAVLPSLVNDRNRRILQLLGDTVIKNSQYRSRWENSYYFITGQQFKNIIIHTPTADLKYIDTLSTKGAWTTFYAMDWVSQLGFYHKYLNNRISYVTGGTGVGKSSQIPKLLLYSLKMIDYKQNASIACTQPRVAPTVSNAETISAQMGIPIIEYSPITKNEIRSNNYYIQYRSQEKKHFKPNQPGLKLIIMTDGLLDTELSSPDLKKGKQNRYDIVIVDEAHEHNKNMDLILTKMQRVAYHNNSVRLIIISATMDDDEPTYRRYYRNINDNLLHPINLDISTHNIDRINVDRRIHISPPGETTQYKIVEHYRPHQTPYDVIAEILKTAGPEDDILLFQPGVREITESIDLLNKSTPANTIALPFYSDMSDAKKDIMRNISTEKFLLRIPKTVRLDESYDESKLILVKAGTYTRIIVVATKIAEASITIDSLRYVVDTGTERTPKYNYISRSEPLILDTISDSARLQRKGRVGRVAPGEVYYLYKEGYTQNKKKQFDISVANLKDILLGLLANSNSVLFTPSAPTPSSPYIGNRTHYDYENEVPPAPYYTDGYQKDVLDDIPGTFYIVHPEELSLIRNITGLVISPPENAKMKSFWRILYECFFVAESNGKLYKTQFGEQVHKMYVQFVLQFTSMSQLVSYMYSRTYGCSDDMIKLIAMQKTIKSPKELALLEIKNNKTRPLFEKTLNIYGSSVGDSDALIRIATDIINVYTQGQPHKITNLFENRLASEISTNIVTQKALFLAKKYDQLDHTILDNFITSYNTNKLENSDTLTLAESHNLFSNNVYLASYLNSFEQDQFRQTLTRWAERKYLNYDKITRFYKNYIGLLNSLKQVEEGLLGQKFVFQDKFVPKLVTPTSLTESIQVSLIHGYFQNLVRHISTICHQNNLVQRYYINLLCPNVNYVYKLEKIIKDPGKEFEGDILNNTFIKPGNVRHTLLFITQTDNEKTGDIDINMIENISPALISKLVILPPPSTYDSMPFEKLITELSLSIDKRTNVTKNKIIQKYQTVLDNIKVDLYNNTSPQFNEKLSVINMQSGGASGVYVYVYNSYIQHLCNKLCSKK